MRVEDSAVNVKDDSQGRRQCSQGKDIAVMVKGNAIRVKDTCNTKGRKIKCHHVNNEGKDSADKVKDNTARIKDNTTSVKDNTARVSDASVV